ncbi:hypothetical protein EW146_g9818 [Bondarzewia mesenterica]|uniref:Ricin B lectin domain-containing protein n=1 Tax=Bondarzewia mesenterica TaxID=1095465 RepID=A0A4S4L4D6_9AGAM|nr:hypothetical protein EW146_g9818 [Bondarzewia mesenterica]
MGNTPSQRRGSPSLLRNVALPFGDVPSDLERRPVEATQGILTAKELVGNRGGETQDKEERLVQQMEEGRTAGETENDLRPESPVQKESIERPEGGDIDGHVQAEASRFEMEESKEAHEQDGGHQINEGDAGSDELLMMGDAGVNERRIELTVIQMGRQELEAIEEEKGMKRVRFKEQAAEEEDDEVPSDDETPLRRLINEILLARKETPESMQEEQSESLVEQSPPQIEGPSDEQPASHSLHVSDPQPPSPFRQASPVLPDAPEHDMKVENEVDEARQDESHPQPEQSDAPLRPKDHAPEAGQRDQGPVKLTPGVYTMTTLSWDTALDLHGGNNKYAIAFGVHGGENQQWEFLPLGTGYAIRSMRNAEYLSLDGKLEPGVSIVTIPFRVFWEVEIVEDVIEEEDRDEDVVVRIRWPFTDLNFVLKDAAPGTQAKLSEETSDGCCYWRLHPLAANPAPYAITGQKVKTFDMREETSGGFKTITKTATTTTTTVTTVTKVVSTRHEV